MLERAREDDIDRMVELLEAVHAESPRYSRLAFSPRRVEQTIRALLGTQSGLVLVARRDGQVVGGLLAICEASWMSDQPIAEELALFVAPEHRGTFIACRLVSAFAAWAKLRGARWAQAGVSTGITTERTAALYEKLGFEPFMIGLEIDHGN